MTEDEHRARGNTRRLVFQNLANGVPLEQVMADQHLSALEVEQARKAVARKLTEYLVHARQPVIACGDLREIRWNRKPLLALLARIGDLSLSTEFILYRDRATQELARVQFGRITTQAIDHPDMVEGAKQRMAAAAAQAGQR